MNKDTRFNDAGYLVDKYLNDLIRLALVYVKNTDDAEDIAQQVFLTYLHKRPQFTDEPHAKNWLFKVTANKSKNHLRALKNTVNYDELAGVLSTEDADYGHTDGEQAVLDAVLRLKPAYREVIHLYFYCDYNTTDISKILGIPQATVRTRLARAKAVLEKDLKGGKLYATQLQECNE
jgi:RNA polymerase sigma-70 factor (ECF subfamily)